MAKSRPMLPAAVDRSYTPFEIKEPGHWLILSDVHLPYHDSRTVEAAVKLARRHRGISVLLNGDILDCHYLSSFDHDPSAPRYTQEREAGIAFLSYLRDRLPKARIVFKEGNHEERLQTYLMRKAPDFWGLECMTMASMLKLKDFGIEWVGEKRVIRMGRLNVIHGHEYRATIQAPVNPARGLFLRAKSSALCGHHHQTSEHHEPTLEGTPKGCWSTGCACQLSPAYSPLNKWNHGAAFVEIGSDGIFNVRNLRFIDGVPV